MPIAHRTMINDTSSPNPPGPVLPIPVQNPMVWLDASQMDSLFIDDAGTTPVYGEWDQVGRWSDLSGNNHHFTQTDPSRRPLYSNGLHFLGTNGLAYSPIRSAEKTIFIVHKGESDLTEKRLFMDNRDSKTAVGAGPESGHNLSFVRENVTWTDSGFQRVYTTTVFNLIYHSSPFLATLSRYNDIIPIQHITEPGDEPFYHEEISMTGVYHELIVYGRVLSGSELLSVNQYLHAKWSS